MGEIYVRMFDEVFPNAVEDDNCIVDGKADNRQNGGDKKRVNFDMEIMAEEGEKAEDNEGVVEKGDDGGNTEFPGSVGLGDTSKGPGDVGNNE